MDKMFNFQGEAKFFRSFPFYLRSVENQALILSTEVFGWKLYLLHNP